MPFGKTVLGKITLVFMLPLILLFSDHPVTAADPDKCDVHNAACMANLPESKITLDITPKPVRAMKDLTFRLEIFGKQPDQLPHIDLGMPGMKMGPNRVTMEMDKQGVYKGRGVIVRCPSGKRTWKADVALPGLGTVQFIFDVIY
ncbi:MAG: hypothetical protein ABII06_12420 [Pseudomonadota bacterium]